MARVDKDAFYRELGRRVAARRAARRLTQVDIAEAIGSSRASIANIEAGRQGLQVHQLYPLARALDLDDLSELIPTGVPATANGEPLGDVEVSAVQRAQIESLVRNAVASARPKGSRR
jgi:transcriptional regulator with XRE-family HTH domain